MSEKQMPQKSDRIQNVKDTLCYVCDKKIGDRPYRRLPKDSYCKEERLYHVKCGCGSKNWNEKFPEWALHTIDKKLKGGHKIMSAVTLEQLKELGRQLNEILEPAIDLELAEEELKHKVIIAIEYVQPDDDLSADALQVIEALKQEQSTSKEATEMPKKNAKKVEKKEKVVKKDTKKDAKKDSKKSVKKNAKKDAKKDSKKSVKKNAKVGKSDTKKEKSSIKDAFLNEIKQNKNGITMKEIQEKSWNINGKPQWGYLREFIHQKLVLISDDNKIFYIGK